MNKYLLLILSLDIVCSTEKLEVQDSQDGICPSATFCSPWHYCDGGHCKLGSLPPYETIDDDGWNTSIMDSRCITFNAEERLMETGFCSYFITSEQKHFHNLPNNISTLNDYMCGKVFNRDGTLCGKCKDGYYPLAYSFDMKCIQCPNSKSNWWKFVLVAFLPLTIFYFIILFFKINITSSPLFGFVYVVQNVSYPALARLAMIVYQDRPRFLLCLRILTALTGIWNLDILRSIKFEICLGTDTLQTMALDLIVGIYPLLLMLLSYFLVVLHDRNFRLLVIIWKPFQILFNCFRRNWNIRTSTIDVFATFFLLSNVKFVSVTFDLLVPVKVYQLNSTGHIRHSWRLFYDATIPYFGHRHLPYAIMAIATFLLFVLLPVLILFLYPFCWFQKLLNRLPGHWYILHTFVDSFQGCYKDGTEGTQDCRWFASLFFLLRLFLFALAAITLTTIFFVLSSIVLIVAIVLLIIVQPYKNTVRHYSTINANFLLLMTMGFVTITATQLHRVWRPQSTSLPVAYISVISVLGVLYVPALVIHYFGLRRCCNYMLTPIRKLQAWRQGYDLL